MGSAGYSAMAGRTSFWEKLKKWGPIFVIAPSIIASFIYVFVFAGWTFYISLSDSTLLPSYGFRGFENYIDLWNNRRWGVAYSNLFFFSAFYVVAAMAVGLLLALLLDQKIRAESFWRTMYMYPLAVSFIVTGTVWQWLYNPTAGFQFLINSLGWTDFEFALTTDRKNAIWAIIITGVWQSAGFTMALFLAGLRSVDGDIIKAASIDGCIDLPDLPQGDPALDRADLPRRCRRAVAGGDQDLRSRRGADQFRPRHLDHLPRHLRLRPDVPAWRNRQERRRGDDDPRGAGSRSGALLAVSGVAPQKERPWLKQPSPQPASSTTRPPSRAAGG